MRYLDWRGVEEPKEREACLFGKSGRRRCVRVKTSGSEEREALGVGAR